MATTAVLDTNVVLDWLVFGDPGVVALAGGIEAGQVRWLACPRMRVELTRSLGYASIVKWKPDSERVLSSFDRWAQMQPDPPLVPGARLKCRDPDDQVFIDLALTHGVRWLFTRDRALLDLAARATLCGLEVRVPSSGFAASCHA